MDEQQIPIQEGELLTPIPRSPGESITMSFINAMKEVISGRKITRIGWANTDYCILKDEALGIFKDGKFFTYWNISLGDIEAEDWIVKKELSESN